MTWAQKAAISACSPALLMPQPLSTSILGTFKRSGEDVQEDGKKDQEKSKSKDVHKCGSGGSECESESGAFTLLFNAVFINMHL